MDTPPITEETRTTHSSIDAQKKHACDHNDHTAIGPLSVIELNLNGHCCHDGGCAQLLAH